MTQDGEQSPLKRRSSRPNTGGQDPMPLPYPRAMERVTSPNQTDRYSVGEETILDLPRPNTSVVRLNTPQSMQPRTTSSPISAAAIPPRRQQGASRNLSRTPRTTTQQPPLREKSYPQRKIHWLLPTGVGMVAMLVLWMVGASIVAWGIQRYDDVRYGMPRTFQIDQTVGHGGDSRTHPSHFVAVNLNRQAIVIEFMAGDPAKSVSYVAPVYIAGEGGNLAPVTLEFRDVTGDGKLDMIIHIHLPSQDQASVFVNDGTKFRPSNGNDKIRMGILQSAWE